MAKQLIVIEQREIARDTFEVHFEKPVDFVFTAGQNINLKVPELRHEDPKGPRRTFTVASAPHEERVIIATRHTGSGYKKTLLGLAAGAACEYIGPQGKFIRQPGEERIVFLAGGIGITPFRSMLADLEHGGDWPLTCLLYSNADLAGSAYHDLFERMSRAQERFRYVPTLNRLPEGDGWSGERRLLGAEVVRDHVADWSASVFYLCGPPPMITALTGQLQEMGLAAERVRSESLYGY